MSTSPASPSHHLTLRLSLAQILHELQLQPASVHGSSTFIDAAGAAEADGGHTSSSPQKLVLGRTGQTVGLVYYRAGYTPDDYPTDQEWQARQLIEVSCAAKCPSVAYQLAGSKKVQQDLARPGVVERFMGADVFSDWLFGCLAEYLAVWLSDWLSLWSLDDPGEPATAAVLQEALQQPERFVLKPQREGGGNNLYGQELVQALQDGLAAGGEGLAAYILMQRIIPPPQRSIFVRGGAWREDESLSELGIYGTYLRAGPT
eukprot:gene13550-13677_t